MMQWSKYQQAIFDAFENTGDSLLIEAVAGSGKTTVLVELARIMRERQAGLRGCFMAFNKSIATTLQERIGGVGNVVAMTLHSAGWAAWRRAGGMDWVPRLDQHKVSNLMRTLMTWEERKRWEETTRKLVGFAKGIGLVPHDDGESVVMVGTSGELHDHVHFERDSCGSNSSCMRLRGLVPDTDETWESLIEHYGLDERECNIALVRKILARSIETARETCDYDDMLMMPVVSGVPFEKYDVVLVDEAQDVSGIQMEMISRMVKACPACGESERCDSQAAGRVIAVGDRKQSIYGFRGAGTESMDQMQQRFGMRELPLSVTYRCPGAVVDHARQWVPQIESREGAPDGVVFGEETDYQGQCEISLTEGDRDENTDSFEHGQGHLRSTDARDSAENGGRGLSDGGLSRRDTTLDAAAGISKWRGLADFAAGDAILCRLNRPLIAAAFALIRRRIPCRILGREIGAGLVQLVKKPGFDAGRPVGDWERWVGDWLPRERARLLEKRRAAQAGQLEDRVATIRVFIEALITEHIDRDPCGDTPEPTIGELIQSIEEMFRDRGPEGMVTLATVHKAKGLEWPRVFILDAGELMPVPWGRGGGWELQQELNCCYIAATRASRELRYVTSRALGIARER